MRRITSRFLSAFLAALFVFTLVSNIKDHDIVNAADEGKTKKNTTLGATGIYSPEVPGSADDAWFGSYIWFGMYDGNPIKFRVLDPETDKFGSDTIFLDSDRALYYGHFDNDSQPNQGASRADEWAYCDIRTGLNGDEFLEKDGVFTAKEKNAIVSSKIKGHDLVVGNKSGNVTTRTKNFFSKYVALNGEKVFILDAEDVSNSKYGYCIDDGLCKNRVKKGVMGIDHSWWLRSSTLNSSTGVGAVDDDGVFYSFTVSSGMDIAPALNIDRSSVFFTTKIKYKSNVSGAEYKLTLKNDDLSVTVPESGEVTVTGNAVSIPFMVSGKDAGTATRISVLILDKEYKDGNPNNASILYYGTLCGASSNGRDVFYLSDEFDINEWGSKYHVYILAEDINDIKQTDYTSKPYEVRKPEPPKPDYTVTISGDAGVTGSCSPVKGKSGTKVALAAKVSDGYKFNKWEIVSGDAVIASPSSANTTLTIGNSDVVVKATSEKINASPVPTSPSDPTAAPTSDPSVTLTLNKSADSVVCGKTDTLKATLKGSRAKITWTSSDPKVATVDADGKVTAKMAGSATITAAAAGKSASCTVTVLYKDVTKSKDFWFAPTNSLTAKGVVKGYDKQTKFKPANECTRAQMVTFIWRLMGEPAPKAKTCKFKDVKKSDYYYKACIWGNENHIVEGYKNGTFGPKIVCA